MQGWPPDVCLGFRLKKFSFEVDPSNVCLGSWLKKIQFWGWSLRCLFRFSLYFDSRGQSRHHVQQHQARVFPAVRPRDDHSAAFPFETCDFVRKEKAYRHSIFYGGRRNHDRFGETSAHARSRRSLRRTGRFFFCFFLHFAFEIQKFIIIFCN